MRVLGIDSATLVAGVAVIEEEKVIAEGFLQTRKTHSERLLPLIAQWLQEAELTLKEIDGIAVTSGPGSFTGLRIGAATAKGLAQAAGKPLVGVPTLDALALNAAGVRLICPILNARKGEVYTALYASFSPSRLGRLSHYAAFSPAELVQRLTGGEMPWLEKPLELGTGKELAWGIFSGLLAGETPVLFLGDGVEVYRDYLEQELNESACWALPGQNFLRAAQVAFLGLESFRQGRSDDVYTFVPHYIRLSEAEAKKQKQGKA